MPCLGFEAKVNMGSWLSFLKDPLHDCFRYSCNGVDINSECGFCGCTCHTEAHDILDSGSECSFEADTLCGTVRYSGD